MNDSATYYDAWFSRLIADDATVIQATIAVIHRYLDGKPAKSLTIAERDTALWSSFFWKTCPDEIFHTEGFALALAKYLGRDGEYEFGELRRALSVAPEVCKRAIRYSKVFLMSESKRWQGLQGMFQREVSGYRGFVRECRSLSNRYAGLRREADDAYGRLSGIALVDLIVLASMSAFKTELPPFLGLAPPNPLIPHPSFRYPLFTEAVARLLARRRVDCAADELVVTEEQLRLVFKRHMYPLLLAHYADGGRCGRNLDAFERFIDAQIRFDGFRQNEISHFCFDIVGDLGKGSKADRHDHAIRAMPCFERWVTSSIRDLILKEYWNSVGAFQWDKIAQSSSEMRLADGSIPPLAKTLANLAILRGLFGVEDKIDLGEGIHANLDQVCMFLELARDNYRNTLLIPFADAMCRHGDWAAALREVIESGMFDGLQQRYPILFATHDEKLRMLRQFTVTDEQPAGSDAAAEALMSFWGNELVTISDHVHLKSGQLKGGFAEQPLLRLGDYVFTLPWVLATQDTPTALINNLRRVRPKRPDAKRETHRIELHLAEQMQLRGFRTVVGYEPDDGDGEPPGEIDLIATLDGHFFVFEIKSGYIRQTFESAWIHRTTTLRKAGRQLKRKLEALRLASKEDLIEKLGIDAVPGDERVHCWIVDTSNDFDRERFSGFIKVSMTEIIVALQDSAGISCEVNLLNTLYPEAFCAKAFVDVIEQERIWVTLEQATVGKEDLVKRSNN